MPFPFSSVLDNFNRTENPLSQSGSWATSTPYFGDTGFMTADGSTAVGSSFPSYSGSCRVTSYTRSANVEVYLDLGTIPSIAFAQDIHICWLDSQTSGSPNGYYLDVQARNSSWALLRVDSGTANSVSSGSATFSVGDSIGLEVRNDGNVAGWHKTGGVWSQLSSVADNTYTGFGYIGLETPGDGHYDNFGGGQGLSALTATGAETVGVTDTAAAFLPTLTLSVGDATIVSETTTVAKTSFVSVGDGATVAEGSATATLVSRISTTDAAFVSDPGPATRETSFFTITDSATVVEGLSTTVTPLSVSTTGTLISTDGAVVGVMILAVSTGDVATVNDTATALPTNLRVVVGDTTVATDGAIVASGVSPILASDLATATDVSPVLVLTPLRVGVSDAAVTADTCSIAQLGFVSVSDTAIANDLAREILGPLILAVSESVFSVDASLATEQSSILTASVFDTATTVDAPTASLVSQASVSDTTAAADLGVTVQSVFLSRTIESTVVTDQVNVRQITALGISDSTTASENATVIITIRATVSDSATAADRGASWFVLRTRETGNLENATVSDATIVYVTAVAPIMLATGATSSPALVAAVSGQQSEQALTRSSFA